MADERIERSRKQALTAVRILGRINARRVQDVDM